MKYFLFLLSVVLLPLVAQTQLHCGTDEMYQKLFDNHPEYKNAILNNHMKLEAASQNFTPTSNKSRNATYIIPVVFHVVHNFGPENISDAQIYDAVEQVNIQFRKLNADTTDIVAPFKPLAADTEIEIRLARLDPNGNCTNGITRTASPLTLPGDHSVKSVIQWPPDQYLNIYVCRDAAGLAGHALLPSAADTIPAWDGIVMRHDYIGTIGTSSFFRRTVVTHEIGHYLNLQHIWGGNNVPNYYYLPVADAGNCAFDDGVNDTPETIGWQSCNLSANTCSSLDNVQNYMDYAYCARMFTDGQKQRMHTALNSSIAGRNNLWTTTNLIATGTNGSSNLCKAKFNSDNVVICEGESIIFSDESYHGVTQRNWTFTGGTPSTSTDSVETVTYTTPGVNDVQLEVGNGSQTVDTIVTSYITVLPSSGTSDYVYESFEDSASFYSKWIINAPTENSAFLTDVGYSSLHSLKFDNFNGDEGWTFELTSYPIDASNLNDIHLTFDWAYAQVNPTDNDQLQVLVSNDCGQSWSLRKNISAQNNLSTVSDTLANSFSPSGDMEWKSELVNNFGTSQFLVDNLMIRFKFTGDGGNNFFIDNISIAHPDVLDQEEVKKNIELFPNPTTSQMNIKGNNYVESVSFYDLQGRMIQKIVLPGKRINVDFLSQGAYLVYLNLKNESRAIKKLTVN